jgi:hypothetical protein
MDEPPHFPMKSRTLEGGCLCGAVRYAVQGPAVQTTVCHCRDCQIASGAPLVAWTFFPGTAALSWTRGNPKVITFANRERSFCGDCGTPLKFYDPSLPQWFEMNTCSFDDPSPHPPADECWITDRLPWSQHLLELPKFHEHAPLPDS